MLTTAVVRRKKTSASLSPMTSPCLLCHREHSRWARLHFPYLTVPSLHAVVVLRPFSVYADELYVAVNGSHRAGLTVPAREVPCLTSRPSNPRSRAKNRRYPSIGNFAKETLCFLQINPQSKALSGKYVFSFRKRRIPLLDSKYVFFFWKRNWFG